MLTRLIGGLGTAAFAATAFLWLHPTTAAAPPAATPPATARPAPAPPASPTTNPSVRIHPAQSPADPDRTAVIDLQRRLGALGYDVGAPDGTFGERTRFALIAFQKVEGLTRDGKPGPRVDAALARATAPRAIVPNGEATRIEVDLRRQVLLHWVGGELARVLPVSTGRGGELVTPTGRFTIERKVPGIDDGPLGKLYSPMYFHHGVAIHGYPSEPAVPASHGCVRIPMYATASFYGQVAIGTPVYVVHG
jgi:peptidoglycan hydrolase-like protein with peptidoglycan-binding domain